MISWLVTVGLALLVARIVWLSVKCENNFRRVITETNAQIESIRQNATRGYRERYGREPSEAVRNVALNVIPSAKK